MEDGNECSRLSRARATDKARGKSGCEQIGPKTHGQKLVLRATRRTRTRRREGRGRERAGIEPVNDDCTEKRRIEPDRSSFLGSIWEWSSCDLHSEKLLEAESY